MKPVKNIDKVTEMYKELEVNWNKLECYDVNKNIIEYFGYCSECKDIDENFPEIIKKYIEKNCKDVNKTECIDLLGVYIPLKDNDKSNVLLSKEKINEVANDLNYQINEKVFYEFVKAHELAHVMMYPKLAGIVDCKVNYESQLYKFIEESLANAFALKIFKDNNSKDYERIVKFVEKQSPQYKYSLELINNFNISHMQNEKIDEVYVLMCIWKNIKCDMNNYKLFLEILSMSKDYKSLLIELISKKNFIEYLPKDVKDVFIF